MPRVSALEHRIGRRLRVRDLQVFLAVAECGSMAKAAAQLGVTQPAVSEIVAGLEDAFGARLFDRSSQGVEVTLYGRALLNRAVAALDELEQGAKDIAFLADPTVGELRIGSPESIASAFLPTAIESFARDYPGICLHVDQVRTPGLDLPELRARKLDFVLTRLPHANNLADSDLNIEVLFNDKAVVAAGIGSRWGHRRDITLSDLVDAPWVSTPADSLYPELIIEAFQSNQLKIPKIALTTFSVHLRTHLLSRSDFVAVMPRSVLHFNAKQFGLKSLQIKLPLRPFPVIIVTLKSRTLSPAAELFIKHLRALTKSISTSG
jgi:DNA-binding transcriptional LysR family regulator